MTTLVEFLRARLDEDQRGASAVHDISICDKAIYGRDDPGFGWECDCGQPARVLAEVDAKRRIVDYLAGNPAGPSSTAVHLAKLLALPHADHPDYDPS